MASLLFGKAKESFLTQSPALIVNTATMRASIGRQSAYTVNGSTHQYKSDMTTVQNASAALSSVSCTLGVYDESVDPTFTAVSAGAALDFIGIWKDTGGADTTNPLLCYIEFTGIVPNGGDIVAVFDNGANRIFAL